MTSETSDDAVGFADLALADELVGALAALGYEEPTPIQRAAIPPLLEGRDLLGQAATGTGKTAAFALPLLHRLGKGAGSAPPRALVLVPTRELATQVAEAVHRYGRDLGIRTLPIYGGAPIVRQLKALERGVDVVVATPGRALDHIRRRTLRPATFETIILDEADEMLDMGFAEDIEAILSDTSADRQTVLFSATMPPRIARIVGAHLTDPVRIQLGGERHAPGEAPKVRQRAFVVPRAHKPAALGRVLDHEEPTATIVFCRTRDEVDTLTETLNGRGYRAEALHGGMSQDQRTRAIGRLKAGTTELLVATDVAARGLDVDSLSHVVNYDVPAAPEAYVHRIGRVGRAGREGVAITFAQPREHRMLKAIERVTRQPIAIEKLPTLADLRVRRLEATREALAEALSGDGADLDAYRVVVESLAEEHGLEEVALAAVRMAHQAAGRDAEDEPDIPDFTAPRERPRDRDRPERPGRPDRPGRPARPDHADHGDRRPPRRRDGAPAEGMTRLFVGAGRERGIRPQDLVGAIANEAGLNGRQIGAIEIADRFSLVEVPEAAADHVVSALRGRSIKGKKTTVRRERFGGPGARRRS
ncbi:ATP-dependent RNA helicase DeaD [Baekduia alba]|uniref:DEAD/DEAH box helicase n=1 Tax=Baekduia alba TaxID=2997333 RepID=UPI00233FA46F|nr:DEAD/DEAH box helicase [Baekduia alba]WCB94400.1 ATP-dependent RNA helicase DeaD [Baekduia alba]